MFMFGLLNAGNLEDDTGSVTIDLRNLDTTQGYVFESCFVVVEGILEVRENKRERKETVNFKTIIYIGEGGGKEEGARFATKCA